MNGSAALRELGLDVALPSELVDAFEGCGCLPVTSGKSAAKIFRVEKNRRAVFFLKIARDATGEQLSQEQEKLVWMKAAGLPVPIVQSYTKHLSNEFLLLTALPGLDASQTHAEAASRIVTVLAHGLRLLHSVPIAACPFDETLTARLRQAERRIAGGLVDETDFDEENQGLGAAQLYRKLLPSVPQSLDAVFTHGDYCLPNVIVANKGLSGFVDCARAGVADRYQDLALAARSVEHNFGARWVPKLFDDYANGQPIDEHKLAFYKLLDEFF